jgi:hypothetical protein
MILTSIAMILGNIIAWFIDLLPTVEFTMPDVSGLNTAVSYLFYFLTKPVTIALLFSTIFWFTAQPIASLVKFIYRKIPGVS